MILPGLIILPLAGGLLAWLLARWQPAWARWVSLLALAADLALALALWAGPAEAGGSPWLLELNLPWIPQWGIGFHLALDGLSLLLILLTCFLGLMAVLVSWREIEERVGFFHFNLLWILAGIIGVFLAMDLFLFYFFWELMLVPMYFIISIWGHENRVYAALKFFIFTQASGLFMLLSILGLYFVHGQSTNTYTFDYTQLLNTPFTGPAATWLMLGFVIAFIVKLPVVPFHTWLPDAHTEAPTAGSVILAGLLLKTGAYGLLRFVLPLFPGASAAFAPLAMLLGVIGILYGAWLAFAQTDLKRLVAYSSVSHMGFVLLGIFARNELAWQGALMEMLAHGISTGALFILVGMLQDRIHTRDLRRLGGLWSAAPRLGAMTLLFSMASLGLPGLGNFIGEFLVLLGAYQANITLTALATVGLVVATVYSLWLFQRTFHGPNSAGWRLPDLAPRDMVIMAALTAAIVWLGLYPQPVFNTARPVVQAVTVGGMEGWRDGRMEGWATVSTSPPLLQSSTPPALHSSNLPLLQSSTLPTLLPLITLAVAALVVMLAIAFYRRHGLAFGLALAGLGLSFASLPVVAPSLPVSISPLLTVDAYALFYLGLIVAAGLAVALLAYGYLRQQADHPEEFYLLLLLATLGAGVLVTSDHFVSFFLGLEILSVSLYTMIAYLRTNSFSLEAGFKYLILAGVSSAFLLFGMALIYAALGTMEFSRIAEFEQPQGILLLTGLAMTVIGIGFKLAVVPFHLWTPDVYEGAPAPVTAFVATVSKGAMLALLLRYFNAVNGYAYPSVVLAFTLIAIASMLGGSLLALLQTNVKRILAYSSITHLGYMLVAFLAAGGVAIMAVTYYLVAYFVTTLCAFGVVTVLSSPAREADNLADYRSLFWRRPWLAGLFTAALLSLAGMPLTAGFIGKFYVVAAGIGAARWLLLGVLVASSAIGIFYYLRIVVAMYTPPVEGEPMPVTASLTLAGSTALAVLTLLLIWLGVYPAPFISMIQTMVARLG